jgi:hypothetical protein
VSRRLLPFGEREALWSLGLASLGFVSMYATLPAAMVLAMRAIRRRRVVDGSEPAIAALAFSVGLLSFLLGYPAMRAIVLEASSGRDWRPWAFLVSLSAMAVLIVALSRFALQVHPEHWMARRAAVLGIAAAVVISFSQAVVVVLGLGGSSPATG